MGTLASNVRRSTSQCVNEWTIVKRFEFATCLENVLCLANLIISKLSTDNSPYKLTNSNSWVLCTASVVLICTEIIIFVTWNNTEQKMTNDVCFELLRMLIKHALF